MTDATVFALIAIVVVCHGLNAILTWWNTEVRPPNYPTIRQQLVARFRASRLGRLVEAGR